MTDIFSLSLEQLAAKIKDAQLSSVEVCEKYIERINKFEKDVFPEPFLPFKITTLPEVKVMLTFLKISLKIHG